MTTKAVDQPDLGSQSDTASTAEDADLTPPTDEAVHSSADDPPGRDAPIRRQASPTKVAAFTGLAMIVALGALIGWLSLQLQHAQRTTDQRAEFVQAARQGAVNLTTIDWQQADGDVKRIIDNATGTFHDDFSKRAQPFVDVVRQVQSKTTGTVTMAGLESTADDHAQVLVAVTVQTTNAGSPQPASKAWRMRIDVQKVGDDVKISNVEFVP